MDITLDLETLSTTPNAAIIEIAACAWDRTRTDTPYLSPDIEDFRVSVDVTDCIMKGCHISESTLAFWQSRADQFEEICTTLPIYHLEDAFLALITWIELLYGSLRKGEQLYLWSQGTDFDLGILRTNMLRVNPQLAARFDKLIRYDKVRDARTFICTVAPFILSDNDLFDPDPATNRQLYSLIPPMPDDSNQSHSALYDARRTTWSVWNVMHGFSTLNSKNDSKL